MSDTDNWPLLRQKLIELGFKHRGGYVHIRESQGTAWGVMASLLPDRARFSEMLFGYQMDDMAVFEKADENEAIAWARANLGREE